MIDDGEYLDWLSGEADRRSRRMIEEKAAQNMAEWLEAHPAAERGGAVPPLPRAIFMPFGGAPILTWEDLVARVGVDEAMKILGELFKAPSQS